jgi:ATP-dependent DNA helicase Rep
MLLNPQQMAAVRYLDGPLLVLAGAGSGKTRVITEKIAYLIQECGYSPHSVFAVTFTNKAANEMKARVKLVLPAHARRGLKIATFHTLGLSIVRKDVKRCGLHAGFTIFDAEDAAGVIRNLLTASRACSKEEVQQIQSFISIWKNAGLTLNEILRLTPDGPAFEEAIRLYSPYHQTLRAYNAVDFDDLICLPVMLFTEHSEVLSFWQGKIRHLLIDEYQDSNVCQYQLVQFLTRERPLFTVVGDDDQSIYAWRGAKPENLKQLKEDYPNLKLIKLEQNYRSSGRILHVANQLISNNPHVFSKTLWSALGPGDFIRVLQCKDEQDEADQVIADMISHTLRTRTDYGDYAILYRGNHQARAFETALRHHGISYHVSGGQSWFSRTEVKDIFAYLRLLCNEADDAAFLRAVNTPKRGIGETTITALGQYAKSRDLSLYTSCDHLALGSMLSDSPRMALQTFKSFIEQTKQKCTDSTLIPQALRELVDIIGYEAYLYEQCDTPVQAQKRMEQVFELIAWVEFLLSKSDIEGLPDVVNRMLLIDRLEQAEDSTRDTVQLMTLHASKGLEFPYVYLVGMEEGFLPHRVSIEDEAIEEERRLAYVGMTRAQKGLCLTLASKRRRAGEHYDCVPSRFLEELPADYIEWFGRESSRTEEQSRTLARNHLAGLKHLLS